MSVTDDKITVNKKQFKFKKRDLLFVVIGVVLAFTARFILVDSQTVHHHANFALYVEGQRDLFDNFTYYEEVASCSTEDHNNPRSRVHMHSNINSLVHVHDAGVTWGHFFANLGYTLGDRVLVTDKGVFESNTNGDALSFILNGQKISSIANRPIASEDRLLINYGKETDAELLSRADLIPDDAGEYNSKPDPSSCSGGSNESLIDRFKRTLGVGQASASHDDVGHGH